MKISVITSVYNNKETINDAIKSVLSQDFDNVEYVVIDGGSTDGTIELIRSFGSKIDIFVSEPDEGIYDGLNKGVEASSGDVICFLHSDDVYASTSILKEVAQVFDNDEVDGVYTDLVYTTKKDLNNVVRFWKSRKFKKNLLKRGWMPAHPTFFLKKEVYNKFGAFDKSYRIAADYDFMLRVLSECISVVYLPIISYKMRLGGASNRSFKHLLQKSKEDFRALKKNKVGGFFSLLFKNLSKCKQFIK